MCCDFLSHCYYFVYFFSCFIVCMIVVISFLCEACTSILVVVITVQSADIVLSTCKLIFYKCLILDSLFDYIEARNGCKDGMLTFQEFVPFLAQVRGTENLNPFECLFNCEVKILRVKIFRVNDIRSIVLQ